jgi:hypothetical protein
MLLLLRLRHPRLANMLSFLIGVATLALGIALGWPPSVLLLGAGTSIALSLLRHFGKRSDRLTGGRGGAALR